MHSFILSLILSTVSECLFSARREARYSGHTRQDTQDAQGKILRTHKARYSGYKESDLVSAGKQITE